MPNKVSIDIILKSLTQGLNRNKNTQTWISYARFKDILLDQDIYSADPSLRNAWKRVCGTPYCLGVTGGNTPESKKMLLAVGWLKQDYGLEIIEEQANKKKETQTATEEC